MAASMLNALLQEKVKTPEYPLVDFGAEQVGAIQNNIAALPGLSQLASRVNQISADEMLKGLERMFPGYSSILAKGTETLQSQMRGEIPEDVRRQIGRMSAERSRAGGYAGSEFADTLEARDLGLTSLGIINQSLNTAERWMAQAASRTPQFNFTSMFITPQQRIGVRAGEYVNKWQRDFVKAQIDALPEPWEQALINLADNIEEVGQSVLSAYAGGAVGGMGGGGGAMMSGAGASGGGGMGYGGGSYGAMVNTQRTQLYNSMQMPASPGLDMQGMYGPPYNPYYNPNFPSGGGP